MKNRFDKDLEEIWHNLDRAEGLPAAGPEVEEPKNAADRERLEARKELASMLGLPPGIGEPRLILTTAGLIYGLAETTDQKRPEVYRGDRGQLIELCEAAADVSDAQLYRLAFEKVRQLERILLDLPSKRVVEKRTLKSRVAVRPPQFWRLASGGESITIGVLKGRKGDEFEN